MKSGKELQQAWLLRMARDERFRGIATRCGVLFQSAGLLVLAQPPQVAGGVVGRGEGVSAVLAEHPTAPGQGACFCERRSAEP